MKALVLSLLTLLTIPGMAWGQAPAPLQPANGEHIAIIGNALADRMQHSGYFETLLHAQFAQQNLVVRNLSASGDEVVTRHRSENFGSPEDWLQRVQADTILAFFGFNESFAGPTGIPKFKEDLDRFLKETKAKTYSNRAPRRGGTQIVLISPIAAERHQDPNFPDPAPINANLTLYAAAMDEVAKANGVAFVDLFRPSLDLYAEAARGGKSLTINGIHLSPEGDQRVAPILFHAIFGANPPAGNLEKLRQSINEKNWQWHQRYRTMDGYNVYGGRSALAYQAGKGPFISDRNAPEPYLSNYKVMQEEMSQRDVLTMNRDQRVWAIAKGGDARVDDSNLPPVTRVRTNKPGPNADETHTFLGGEEAIAKMTVHSGMKVNLFADEKQFPDLISPVQMAWDTRGRLWVAAWINYPERTPTSKVGDKLLVFEDTDGDGKADKVTPFLEDLNCPTGFQFYQDGVIVIQAPDVWFVRDTDGDGKADWKERILMGLDSADSHHTANAICLDPGGSIYLSDGVFHRTQIETALGPVRNNDAAIFRYDPRTFSFETYIPYGFANPHGRVFDRWGNDLVTDATGNNTYFGAAFSGRLNYPQKHAGMKEFWSRPSRPCPGTGILSSGHFPEEFQGNFLNINVIGFQGIFRVKVTEDGSGLKGETLENLVQSTDPNFRPSAISVGPDGALYFLDWHKPLIGHMQHHIRDPNRDKEHGRIYRMTYSGRPLLKPRKIQGEPIPALVELLKANEDSVRELAKVELGARKTPEVIAAVQKWTAALSKSEPEYEHHLMEALWVHQWHNVVNVELLQRMLGSPDHRARAAAARVLCYWRDRVPDALGLFRKLAADSHPRVRLEAVRAASFYKSTEAAEVALAIVQQPLDYYLEYTLKETLRQLEPAWRKALSAGQPLAADNGQGLAYLLASVRTAELQALPRTPIVLETLLARSGLSDSDRSVALIDLSKARNVNRAPLLLDLLLRLSTQGKRAAVADLARLLPLQLPEDLTRVRGRLADLAKHPAPELRPAAWAALAAADNSFDQIWPNASATPGSTADLLTGIPMLNEPEFRARAYDRVDSLITNPGGPEVRRAAIRALVSTGANPEKTFARLAGLVTRNEEVALAAQSLRILPRATWPKDQISPSTTALIRWAKAVPAADRTREDYLQVLQTAVDFAGLLPESEGNAARKDLRDLRVSVFVIRTVREQMRFDTPRLVVEAGKPFEIIVENDDFMPHNLAVVKPGAREKIGAVTEKMTPERLDRQGRAFMPDSPDILAATKLLDSGMKETLKLTAPAVEGDYEYVCTFPGHWQVMFGRLVVTKDVDDYLQKNPVAPLPPANPAHNHGE